MSKRDLDQKAVVTLLRTQVDELALRCRDEDVPTLGGMALALEALAAEIDRKAREGYWRSYEGGPMPCDNSLFFDKEV
jgi:enterochelin esterase-like enzyme